MFILESKNPGKKKKNDPNDSINAGLKEEALSGLVM